MIQSARPIVTLVANIVFCYFVFLDFKSTYENNDLYRPRLWVGRVDQFLTSWVNEGERDTITKQENLQAIRNLSLKVAP